MDRIKHFSDNNHKNTKEVMQRCSMFFGVYEAIEEVISVGKYEVCQSNTPFIEQNSKDKGLYYILEGEVDILVNGRGVARRTVPSHVGEMSVVDPTLKRSATVIPIEECVLLKVEDDDFVKLADKYPRLWRNIAAEISCRLKQRGELVDSKEIMPRVFIGSSSEYLDVAYAIQEGMLHTDISVNVWSQDCFRPSDWTLAALEREADNCDFALFLFGCEDLLVSRGIEMSAPRDNVIFELGLFTGKLSSERVYFAQEVGVDIKIPSDLAGITPIQYKRKKREPLSVSVQPICNKLTKQVKEFGTK